MHCGNLGMRRGPRVRVMLPDVHYEPGWVGAFTRANAPGALPAGAAVVKVNSEPGDRHQDGERGTVLGSISHPQLRGGEVCYFVEWEAARNVAVSVMGRKVRGLQ